ncbi:unnamed protein product [Adineta steineri]|uniref:Uncharacterized protein n=1 Tax=Adineta steineri TaxID=433720 RepID=A0A814SZS7_9BILA|nr:unnamed protein product [Adineta steineri]
MSDQCSGHSRYGECQVQQSIRMNEQVKIMQPMVANNLWHNRQPKLMQTLVFTPRTSSQQWVTDEFNTSLPTNTSLNCANCQNSIDPGNVALHHCEGGCICRTCLENYGSLDR